MHAYCVLYSKQQTLIHPGGLSVCITCFDVEVFTLGAAEELKSSQSLPVP